MLVYIYTTSQSNAPTFSYMINAITKPRRVPTIPDPSTCFNAAFSVCCAGPLFVPLRLLLVLVSPKPPAISSPISAELVVDTVASVADDVPATTTIGLPTLFVCNSTVCAVDPVPTTTVDPTPSV